MARGKTSKVGSRRGNQKVSRTAKKKKGNVRTNTDSAQQPPIDTEGPSNGQTRNVNGAMEYRSKNGWIPAVYHDSIRAQLAAQGPQGTYDVPRKRGKGAGDVTSYHPAYRTYGPDRHNRHPILFRYLQDGYPVPSYTPGPCMYQGQIVLDPDNDPVLMWNEMPLVLSSEYEGYEMEVVRRLNPTIGFDDFRARMPRSIFKAGVWREGWAQSTLSMRNSRFRISACCLAWADREGSDVIKAYIDELLPSHCLAANSTEGFRDLTPYEVKQAQLPNKGKYLKRAGPRALDETTRQQRNDVEQERSTKLLAEHTALVGEAPLAALVDLAPQIRGQKRKRGENPLESEDKEENTRRTKHPARRPAHQAEIVRAAPPPGNLIPAPQSQGQKRTRTESLEDEEQNTRASKRLKFSANNIDPLLLGAGNSGDFGAFGDSAPGFGDLPEDITGPDHANGPHDGRKVPEYLAQIESIVGQEDFGLGGNLVMNVKQPAPLDLPVQNESSGVEKFGVEGDPINWKKPAPLDVLVQTESSGVGKFGVEGDPMNREVSQEGSDGKTTDDTTSSSSHDEQGDTMNREVSQEGSDEETDDTPSSSSLDEQADAKPDFRFADPLSVHDRASIQYALSCTRDECRERLGCDTMPIPTTPSLCYALQWLQIQQRFAERWPLRGDGETPILFQLAAWTDNFDNWKQ